MAKAARARYQHSFNSEIFSPKNTRQNDFVPAGKRRDQTTQELFGSYNDKDLRAMPNTFEPREDAVSAKQKKMQFLTSEVLPNAGYGCQPHPGPMPQYRGPHMGHMGADTEETIDPNSRRHQELSSELFDRSTPDNCKDKATRSSTRLTPNDFKWFNIPEGRSSTADQALTHSDRAYHEKCSTMFDHSSPNAATGHDHHYDQQQKQEHDDGEMKRRHNAHYSDLFGRNTPMHTPSNEEDQHRHRPRHQAHPEDKLIIHQDWTDSKTELLSSGRHGKTATPVDRKSSELHQARVFGDAGTDGFKPPELVEPTHHDNSHKLKCTIGQHTQSIHQAHLRTSVTPDEFYDEAYSTKDWEVVELHIGQLPTHYDDRQLRQHCQGHDLQIIKVSVETDPVGNYCKGRAKVMLRYNPKRDSIQGLVKKLEDANLRVEL